eukprot:m.36470 g.36470  ORF g.36470 m.36470 type:complete len:298 (-) comp11021_c0_seq1:56-949(-)
MGLWIWDTVKAEWRTLAAAAGVASVGLYVAYRIGVATCEARAVVTQEELDKCAQEFLEALAAGGRQEAIVTEQEPDVVAKRFEDAGRAFLQRSLSPWKAMFGFLARSDGTWDITQNVLLVSPRHADPQRTPLELHAAAKAALLDPLDKHALADGAKLLMGHLIDADHDGSASFADFWAFALRLIGEPYMCVADRRKLMFAVIDDDGSGTLSYSELRDWIVICRRFGGLVIDNPEVTAEGLAEAFIHKYGDGDIVNGRVTREQFVTEDFFNFEWLFDAMMRKRNDYLTVDGVEKRIHP